MRNINTLVALVAGATIVALLACGARVTSAENTWKFKVKEFKDLVDIATKLDSAGLQPSKKMNEEAKVARTQLIYSFFREPKSTHCILQFQNSRKVSNDFRIRAINYLKEAQSKKSNWITKIFNGALGDLKKVAKFDPYLKSAAEKYEQQAKEGRLTEKDVDCDLNRFQIKTMHAIMFVLESDIKLLIMEDAAIINRAIYESLKSDKFVTQNNFYEIVNPTQKQRDLLLKFYSDRVDQAETKIVSSVNHVVQPGEFVLGRLLDTCQTVSNLHENLVELQSGYTSVCSSSATDLVASLFTREHKFNQFDHTFAFCQKMLEAL